MKTSKEKEEEENNNRNNRQGLLGWLNPFGYGWERVMSFEVNSLTQGKDAWNAMLAFTQTPFGHIFLILVIGTSTFHSINGIRLIFTESGKLIGKAGRPDYPYDAVSLNYHQKFGIWVALILAAAAMLYGSNILFGTR